jgi:uncharacterized protein YggE
MRIKILLIAIAVFTGTACAHPADGGGDAVVDRSVSVVGTGTVEVMPDRVRISAQASALAQDPATARAQVDRQVGGARQALQRVGIDEDALRAQSIRIQPEFEYRNQERTLRGYRATRDFSVVIDDLDAAGEVLDALLSAGLPQVSGLNYELSDPDAHRSDARDLAIADARAKAEQLAEGLDAEVGAVRHVQIGATPSHPAPMPMMMSAMRESDASYAPDDLRITEQVSVVFDLTVD